MATIRQKRLARATIENIQATEPLNKQQLVASVGYSEIVAYKKATEILESKGVQEELKKLGFDPDSAREVVAEILLAGENDTVKLKAADMIFKVHGTYAAEKHVNLNVDVPASERIQHATEQLNTLYRGGSIPSTGGETNTLDT